MRASLLGAVAWLWLGCFALTSAVRADVQDDEVTKLVDEGLKLRAEERDAEALQRFEQAYAKRKDPRTLAQIALAEQALGRWIQAHAHLTEALSARDDPWIKQRRAPLEGALQRMDGEFGTVEITSNLPGASVFVGDHRSGITPLAQPLRTLPGRYAVRVELAGHQTVTQTVDIAKGKASRVEATLARAEAPPTPAPPPPAAPIATLTPTPAPTPVEPATMLPASAPPADAVAESKPVGLRNKLLIATGSTGVGLLLISAATYGVAGSKAGSLKKDCYAIGRAAACDATERGDRRETVRTLDRASRALLGTGLVFVAGTGIAYLMLRQMNDDAPAQASRFRVDGVADRSSALLRGSMEF